MRVVPIIIDESSNRVIAGTYEFDSTAGGVLIIPSGSSFPGTPTAKELFWRTDEAKLYRRDDTNSAWESVSGGAASDIVSLPIENGVPVAAGNCVGVSSTLGRVTNIVAVGAANARFVGVCTVGGTGDAGGTVLATFKVPGSVVTVSVASYTAGAALFLPSTAGPPTATAPTAAGSAVQRIGYAHSATDLLINPGVTVIL